MCPWLAMLVDLSVLSVDRSLFSHDSQPSWSSSLVDYLGWSVVPFTLHQYDQSVSPVLTVQSVSPGSAAGQSG